MNIRKSLFVVLVITLTGALLTVGGGVTTADNGQIKPWISWNPAGTYYGVNPVYSIAASITIIPNDPACTSISCIQKIFYMDHTLDGMFPDVVTATDTVGNGVRTGPNTWQVTLIRYGTDGAAEPKYIAMITGDFEFPDDASGLERKCTWALYLPEQDKDGDGYPDDDETPMICIPDEGLVPRMRILPMQELMLPPDPGQ